MQRLKWILLTALACSLHAQAKDLVAEERAFLSAYSGKSRQFVEAQLGKPLQKDIAIKPHNADQVLEGKSPQGTEGGEQIEMWVYRGKIQYAPNKFFNTAELTFASDKCVNITFANKK